MRKTKEADAKRKLDDLKGSTSLAEGASAARAEATKNEKKNHELAVKLLRQGAWELAMKKKCKVSKANPPPKSKPKKPKGAPGPKVTKEAQPKKGERKVPAPSDVHGCCHSGLLELLPLERKHLQTYVKEGGWLCGTPCHDCASAESGGDKRVLKMSDLLEEKGRGELGVCCNCGPVAHNMIEEEEPVRKQQWACNMVLCMDCFNRRKTGMGADSGGGRRTRKPANRGKQLDP